MRVQHVLHLGLALAGVLCACGDSRAALEAGQLARFPRGEIVTECEHPAHTDVRGRPECLRLLAPVLGRGVCVPLDIVRPDGARNAPRWGRWTYEYVKTTQVELGSGVVSTRFGDIEKTSLGLEARGEYVDNEFAGEWTFWHPNGIQRAAGSFVGGAMSGEWEFRLADGSRDAELSGTYDAGVRTPARRR
jgi:hypothetical protein